jgi:predicted GIY-YIG superfamily endonuclease
VSRAAKKEWFIYIVRCRDKTLYTGITNDLERRLVMHQNGVASRYTRSRLPVKLVFKETCNSRSDALKKEHAIKKLKRAEKEAYIKDHGYNDH